MKYNSAMTDKIIEGFSNKATASSPSSSLKKTDEYNSIVIPLALFAATSLIYYHHLLLRDYRRFLRLQEQEQQDEGEDEEERELKKLYGLQRSRDRLSFDATHHDSPEDGWAARELHQKDGIDSFSAVYSLHQKDNEGNDHRKGMEGQRSQKDWDVGPRKKEITEYMRRPYVPLRRSYSMEFHYHKHSNWSHFEEYAPEDLPREELEKRNVTETHQNIDIKEVRRRSIDDEGKDLGECDRIISTKTSTTTTSTAQRVAEETNDSFLKQNINGTEFRGQHCKNSVDENKEDTGSDASGESKLSNSSTVKIENNTKSSISPSANDPTVKNKDGSENKEGWAKSFVSRLSSSFLSNGIDSDDGSGDEAASAAMNESYAGDECDAVNSTQSSPSEPCTKPESGTAAAPTLKRMESARTNYNARIMPTKVIMVRHGQSEGNVSENLYATKPDNAMQLTNLGWDQARMAGKALRDRVLREGESVHFIVSPYVRTLETFHGILSAWCDPSEFDHIEDHDLRLKAWYEKLSHLGLTWHEDPRIREQDFGNYQDPVTIKRCKREKNKFGAFYYRFPHGESASDVFDRVSTFLDSMWRSFDLKKSKNYVLITHGISIRVLLARYFRYSIDQFNMLANPKNCEMVILGHDGMGKLRLDGRCELELETNNDDDIANDGSKDSNDGHVNRIRTEVVGYKFHERLRILPKKWVVKRCIRMTHEDTICPVSHSSSE